MENGDIPDINIQALSYYTSNYYAHYGRLNGGKFWYTRSSTKPWIQADIGYQTYVSGVATQGGGSSGCCWVTSFRVSTFYMTTDDNEIYVSDYRGKAKVNMSYYTVFSYPYRLQ